ncbi:hypothetical protein D3C78_1072930 [compost metagenome]
MTKKIDAIFMHKLNLIPCHLRNSFIFRVIDRIDNKEAGRWSLVFLKDWISVFVQGLITIIEGKKHRVLWNWGSVHDEIRVLAHGNPVKVIISH